MSSPVPAARTCAFALVSSLVLSTLVGCAEGIDPASEPPLGQAMSTGDGIDTSPEASPPAAASTRSPDAPSAPSGEGGELSDATRSPVVVPAPESSPVEGSDVEAVITGESTERGAEAREAVEREAAEREAAEREAAEREAEERAAVEREAEKRAAAEQDEETAVERDTVDERGDADGEAGEPAAVEAGGPADPGRIIRIDAPAEREVLAGASVRFPIEVFDETSERPRLVLLDAPAGARLRRKSDGASEFLWQTGPADVGETLVTVEAFVADGTARAGTSVLLRVLPVPVERAGVGEDEHAGAGTGQGTGEGEVVATEADEPPGAGDAFDDSTPLRELARELDLRIGFAAYHDLEGDLFSIPDADVYASVAATEYDILTPENSMKMSFVQPERDRFVWDMSDRVVGFAETHGMAVHGHPLVWRQQIPTWVRDLDEAERATVMREHVAALVSRYRGRIAVWDVVNEALENDGRLVHTTWYRALGEDYFGEAFRVAHEHDPEASLIYNDYGVEVANPKSDALHALLERELSLGTPIHGIGLQMHVRSGESRFEAMRANFRRFAALGLDIYITEMDVATDWRADPVVEAERQAAVYAEILRVCLEEPRCRALQTWGLSDRHAWRGALSGLPFDENFEPKPAVRAMREVMLEFLRSGERRGEPARP